MKRDSYFCLFGKSADQYSYLGVFWLVVFYAGALVFGALFVEPLFQAFQSWAHASPENKTVVYLADHRYTVFFNRLREFFIIATLPLFFMVCGYWHRAGIKRHRSWIRNGLRHIGVYLTWVAIVSGMRRLGVSCRSSELRRYFLWFGFGIALVLLVIIGQLLFTPVSWKTDLSFGKVVGILVSAIAGGVAVSFIEEIVFRGLIYRLCYTAFFPWLAILLTSAFYAYTHFRVPHELFVHANQMLNFTGGWDIAWIVLVGIVESFNIIIFLNLLMLGTLLCLVFDATKSLMGNMGLHAGAVFALITYRKLFDITNGPFREIWGGGGLINGYVPLIYLSLACVFVAIYLRREQARPLPSSLFS